MPNNIAIICKGKNISYGFNMLHILTYKRDDLVIKCKKYNDCDANMYSHSVYLNEPIEEPVFKIFIGDIGELSNARKVFCKFGMNVFSFDNGLQLYVEKNEIKESDYHEFIVYSNELRNKYNEVENDFFNNVNQLDSNWFAKEFLPVSSTGLFGGKKRELSIIQQRYDCLSYIVYFDVLNQFLN